MPFYTFKDKQLNYFKFASIVLDEFPKALRQTFVSMWNNKYSSPPTSLPWDDSVAVRNQLSAQEPRSHKIPTHLSHTKWDCTALFQATIFADSFKVKDAHGHLKTLSDMYIKPLGLASGAFHATVTSSTGNQAEAYALAIDQLRRLRNTACHHTTESIDKPTFDHYVQLAKDSFTVLGLNTAVIDNISGLKEEDFPTNKVQLLRECFLKEQDAINQFLQNEVLQRNEELRQQVAGGKTIKPAQLQYCKLATVKN